MSKNVLVIGSINVDYVIYTDRVPTLGETVTGRDFSMNFGGKGANQAVAIAKAGCNVRMLGAVGADTAGKLALKNLTSFGIDCAAVRTVDAPTGAAVITVCKGDNHIILDEGANAHVTPDVIRASEALFDWADVLVMQYEIPIDSVTVAATLAKRHGVRVILNPAPVKRVDDQLYHLIDIIVPNEFEAELITGIFPGDEASIPRSVQALLQKGCRDAIVTLGGRGCAYTDKETVRRFGVYPVKAVDTTAAGDSFIGGLCAKLCQGKPIEEAVAYASATSALTVSRPGAACSIPAAVEVKEFLKHNTPTKG